MAAIYSIAQSALRQPSWGWNPQTFAAIGTVASTFIAASAALIGVREFRDSRRGRQRAQANQVTAVWISSEPLKNRMDRWDIKLSNTSAQSIYHLALIIAVVGDIRHSRLTDALPTVKDPPNAASGRLWRKYTVHSLRLSVDELSGGESARLALPIRGSRLVGGTRGIAVSFMDCNGHWWARRLDGELFRDWTKAAGTN